MIDMVPKAISLTLVSFSKENLQRELLQELYKPDVLDELLKESDFVVSRRKEVQSMVAALNKAEEYVSSFSLPCIIKMTLTSPSFLFQDRRWRLGEFKYDYLSLVPVILRLLLDYSPFISLLIRTYLSVNDNSICIVDLSSAARPPHLPSIMPSFPFSLVNVFHLVPSK